MGFWDDEAPTPPPRGNPIDKERCILLLTRIIDHDEPPGLAARNLARAVVSLVQDRSGPESIILESKINALNPQHPRHIG
jgi:hypothetical protein